MSGNFQEDNYLPADRYLPYPSDADGFARFQDPDNGQWYFAWHALDELVLRSEGYASETGRDNGMQSVKANKDDDANYRVQQQPDGLWVLALQAANNREIARSPRYDTEQEARIRLPGALAIRAAMAATPKAEREKEDDYLACKEYLHHSRADMHPDFAVFERDGGYYFALLDADGEVLLRSERYQSADARDNGIRSVERNRRDRTRYKVDEKMLYYFVVLTAPNNKEIARSCNLGKAAADALIERLVGRSGAAASADFTSTGGVQDDFVPSAGDGQGGRSWLWWLVPILVLVAVYVFWKGCLG